VWTGERGRRKRRIPGAWADTRPTNGGASVCGERSGLWTAGEAGRDQLAAFEPPPDDVVLEDEDEESFDDDDDEEDESLLPDPFDDELPDDDSDDDALLRLSVR